MRQGCPLSPLLFALYVSRIPSVLDERCQGVVVAGTQFSNLWYADDLVLLAETEEDLGRAL